MIEHHYSIRCDNCGEALYEDGRIVLGESPQDISEQADIYHGWETNAEGTRALCERCRPSQSNERESIIG